MHLAAALIAMIALALPVSAVAHGWYDAFCCDDEDCAPIPASEVTVFAEGYLWTNGNGSRLFKIGESDLRQSQDERYHGCEVAGDKAFKRCLYVPPRVG